MEQDGRNRKNEPVFSNKLRAGRRRTYFFDVRATKGNDYYLTITESKKRFNEDGYDRHKIFLYKEDFIKFINSLRDTIDHIQTELLPDINFEELARRSAEFEERDRDNFESGDRNNRNSSDRPAASREQEQRESSGQVEENRKEQDENEEDLKWE